MGQPQQKNHYTEEEMRREIISTVARLDKSFLRVVHSMMRTYTEEQVEIEKVNSIVGYEADGTPITAQELADQAEIVEEEVKSGATTPAKEFFKETIEWLENTK